MRLRSRPTAIVATAAVVLAVTAASASAATGHSGSDHGHGDQHRHGAALDHIYVIMLENHSQSSVIDDPNAPFITSLAHRYGMGDKYYGVTHPSMPNYLATIAGDNFGIQDDNSQNIVNLDRTNLVDQLEARHVSWDAYMENLPADKLAESGPAPYTLYAKKHNPFVLFDDVKNNPDRMKHVRDYSRLGADLDKRDAPQFVWITPNQCHDMHGGVYTTVDNPLPSSTGAPCPYGSTKDDVNDAALKQKADAFVRDAVETIRGSRSWTKRSAIVIITDENDFTGNPETDGWENADGCCDSPYVEAHDPRLATTPSDPTTSTWPGGTYGGGLIPAVVVTASGPRHFVDHHAYNHYSLLTTIEDNWHLGHIGHAGDAANGVVPMWPLFTGHHGRY